MKNKIYYIDNYYRYNNRFKRFSYIKFQFFTFKIYSSKHQEQYGGRNER